MTTPRRISVIGLGYVGLPVAVCFSRAGPTVGFDASAERIEELQAGYDRTGEVSAAELREGELSLTTDASMLEEADFHIVTVPTPIDLSKQPDLGPLMAASRTIGAALSPGDIVVYESTVYPGATEEQCLPVLESVSGLVAGQDFFVGYSPERINPGDPEHRFSTIKKVISGQTPQTLDIVAQVFESVVEAGVYRAPSIKVAEASKVIENIQRDLNIALINELAVIFNRLDVDTGDVLEAARTKWNFLPFTPGLVGGHCIGVDSYYLTHKAAVMGYHPQVILAGRRINDDMGHFVADQSVKQLIRAGVNVREATVTILGLTFKENVPDLRNSRVVDIIDGLKDYGLQVQVYDPLVLAEEAAEYGFEMLALSELRPAQCVVVAVPHDAFHLDDWSNVTALLEHEAGVVADVKGVLPRDRVPEGVRLWRL